MELDKYSKKYIHYYIQEVPSLIENIFDKHSIKSIADLGSGDGSILFALLKKGFLDNVKKIIAIDISQERLNNVKRISDKILCIVADVCKPVMLNCVGLDLVISNQVIEHLPDEDGFIKEIYRVLSCNGLFYLSTVFKKWYGWYFYRCHGKWTLDPTHVREYTDSSQLLNIIKKYNFEVLEDRKKIFWFPVTDFIFKRIGMKKDVYNDKVAKFLRNVKVPILEYCNWELLLRKVN
jgi:2-polyprenyl-3-methyl-5-hydroxy-6-metoxy-1,4-benzoquinol methylase